MENTITGAAAWVGNELASGRTWYESALAGPSPAWYAALGPCTDSVISLTAGPGATSTLVSFAKLVSSALPGGCKAKVI